MTDSAWRERTKQARIETSREGMRLALQEMGGTADRYFTPEEKVSFAHFAEATFSSASRADLEKFAIPLAQSAGLSELEANWHA